MSPPAPGVDPDVSFAVVLAGPSGAGKTTLRDRLLAGEHGGRFVFSVSMTTRPPRGEEREGVDYSFVDRDRFEARIAAGDMLEHAIVHGEYYGTPKANLDAARRAARHLLLDIDVQGASQVRRLVPDVVSIFVLPPSEDEMLRRLRGRGSETEEQLRRRFRSARSELEAVSEFDYALVNEELDETVGHVRSILDAEERSIARLGERAIRFAERLRDEIEREML